MGTNYYAKTHECEHCGRFDEVHLGKSSHGWQFTFQYNGGQYYKTVDEMKIWLSDKNIKDEYGKTISHPDFWNMVKSKQGAKRHTHNLIDIGGYDFIDSEFS